MHADEVEIDLALVARLIASQFPQWRHLELQPVVPWGTDNALFRLGPDLVVRLPRTERTAVTLAKEREWLPRIAPILPVAVPLPHGHGLPADDYEFEWSVYGWLQGENATLERVTDPARLATDLTQFVSALQRIDAGDGPRPGPHNFFRGAPLSTRNESTRQSINSLGDAIESAATTAAWEAALRAEAWDGPPVWIHGDLDSRNLLVKDGRLSGVIDWGGLGVGDPACDVMVAWKVFSSDARQALRTLLCVDDKTWARARGWVVSQAVNVLSYYTLETNAVLVHEARRWLGEALAEQD